MRTLSIRQWMLVGLLIFLAVAAIFYHLTSLLDQRLLQPTAQQTRLQHGEADAELREIAANPSLWRDAAWQSSLGTRLRPLGMSVVVADPSGAEIFRTGHIVARERPLSQEAVIEDGRLIGTASLFAPQHPDPLAPVGALLAILAALFFVRWQMGRYVVRPLDAMSRAARRIAGGDLEFVLPESRVKEVAEVSAAFQAMGEGLRESIQRQSELEEERRFFIGAIAHDLRTPLFALRGYLTGAGARHCELAGESGALSGDVPSEIGPNRAARLRPLCLHEGRVPGANHAPRAAGDAIVAGAGRGESAASRAGPGSERDP